MLFGIELDVLLWWVLVVIGYPTYAYHAVFTGKLEWLFDYRTGAFRRLIVYPIGWVFIIGFLSVIFF
ncbi:hypothetical protein OA169_00535 [Acidimicrobiaceae bacterium]|nr:hypothetical protein [Acidimicrobiaceae bacterium]